MSRLLDKRYPHAYRVVEEVGGRVYVYGPYAVLSSAKGKRTTIINEGSRYGTTPKDVYIERTPAGEWTKVEL